MGIKRINCTKTWTAYTDGQKRSKGDDEYYSIFFEDPDRMKIEYVYAPNYCDPN